MDSEEHDWSRRELPVLKAVVECLDKNPEAIEVRAEHLLERHLDGAFELGDVKLALKRLELGGFVTRPVRSKSAWRPGDSVAEYTAPALREVGAWPSPEAALGRLVEALGVVAESSSADEETRNAAQRVARYLGSSTNAVGLNIASFLITGQFPGQG